MFRVVKSADLQALDTTVRGAFLDAYRENPIYKPRWPLYATKQTSTSKKNQYPQILDAAVIREWNEGGRVVNGITIDGAEVENQLWEKTYGIDRTDLDDDASGAVREAVSRMRSMAGEYLRHPDKLCAAVLTGNTLALDGVALFSASHKVNPNDPASATFTNTASGGLTAANAADARAALLEMKAANGEPANDGVEVALIVPPAKELAARKIAQADTIIYSGTGSDSPEQNVFRGAYLVIVEPRLAASYSGGSDTQWYMTDVTDPENRGIIYQEREMVEIVSKFSPTDEDAFKHDRYVWGTRARYTAAAGNPRKILRRTG